MLTNDVVIGLQHGDESKGKIVDYFCRNYHHDYNVRFSGGPNAGHTIFINGAKYVLHSIPSGILRGIKSIIGPGCVVGPEENFMNEVSMLQGAGIDVKNLLKVAHNTIVIKDEHLVQDQENIKKIGSTGRGITPAYIERVARTATRAQDCEWLKPYLCDTFKLLNPFENTLNERLLFEGSQGFRLDLDWGEYPYVTSNNVHVGSIANTGFPLTYGSWNIVGVAKVYETYVGTKDFQKNLSSKDKSLMDKIQEIGEEFGATTGRKRQCNWLDLNQVVQAMKFNDASVVVFNKVDVLEKLGVFKIINPDKSFKNIVKMMEFIESFVWKETLARVQFSGTKDGMDLVL